MILERRRGRRRYAAAIACAAATVLIAAAQQDRASEASDGPLVLSPGRPDAHNAVIRACPREPLVALTFDDGPDPRWTPAVLAILRRHDARATFFAVGEQVDAHPALARAIVAQGSEVANHTFDHQRLTQLGDDAVRRELVDAGRSIARAVRRPAPFLFRPPWGDFDPRVGAIGADLGLTLVGWDVPLERLVADGGVAAVLARVRRGSIIAGHDGRLDRSRTLAALDPLLDGLARRGLRAVGATELLRSAARHGSRSCERAPRRERRG